MTTTITLIDGYKPSNEELAEWLYDSYGWNIDQARDFAEEALTRVDNPTTTKQRLEYLRAELRAASISYGELSELQDLAAAGEIDPGDVELLEAAGVPEFSDDDDNGDSGDDNATLEQGRR